MIATLLGETGGDALSMSMDLGHPVATAIFATALLSAVGQQISVRRRFDPFSYWTTIIATTTLGTTLADFAVRSLGIGYAGGTALLIALLLTSLAVWYCALGTVSVEFGDSRQAEVFYWVTIMFSQTLGTALGDWTADTADLGYAGAASIFSAMLTLVVVFYFRSNVSRTLLFWAAFVLTRPLGAVVGDHLDKPVGEGGMALSRYSASFVLLLSIVSCLVVFRPLAARGSH